jgi:putative acetyltransferase
VGGGGFSRLKGTTETEAVCELQKLYFLPEVRGQGVGKRLLSLAINQAARLGYRDMYLESLPQMEKAMSMYEKFDFQPLIAPMGNTGHYNCTIFMCRSLEPATSSRS